MVEDSTFEGPYLRHGALIQFVAHNNVLRGNTFNGTKLDAIDLHGELEYLNEISGNVITDVLTGAGIGLGNTGVQHPAITASRVKETTFMTTRSGTAKSAFR